MTTDYPTPKEMRDLAQDLRDQATRNNYYAVGLENWATKIEGPAPTPVPTPAPVPQSSGLPSQARILRPNANGTIINGGTFVLNPRDELKDVTINGDATIRWAGGKANRVVVNGNALYKGAPGPDTSDIFCNGQSQLVPDPGSAPFEAWLIRFGGWFGSSDGGQFVRLYNPNDSSKSFTGHATLHIDAGDFRQNGTNAIPLSPGNDPHMDCIQLLGVNVAYITNPVCDMFKSPDFEKDPATGLYVPANPESHGRTSALRLESFGEGGEMELIETHGGWFNGGAFAISGNMFDPSKMPSVITHYDPHFGPETMSKRTFVATVKGFAVGTLVRPTDYAGNPI